MNDSLRRDVVQSSGINDDISTRNGVCAETFGIDPPCLRPEEYSSNMPRGLFNNRF